MLILKTFEQQFPNFPIVLTDEIPEFKEICVQQIRELTRLQRVPAALRSTLDNERLKDLEFIRQLLEACPDACFHFFHLLENTEVFPSLGLQTYISKIWTQEIQYGLIDEEDPSPLFHIHLFKNLFYRPSQIAGLLIALLTKNISDDEIILSGLLHHYFTQCSDTLSEVHTIYDILQARVEENSKIAVFLTKVALTSCAMTHNPHMALNGRIVSPSISLQSIEIQAPAYSHFFSEEQFFQALKLFQDEFIIYLFQIPQSAQQSSMSLYFEEWLTHQSEETIKHLYSKILNEIHSGYLMGIFQNLTKLTPPTLIEKLFAQDRNLFWILLAIAPEHLKKYSRKQIFELAQEHPVTEKNQYFVAMVCKNRKYQLLQDNLYHSLFELQMRLAQPDLDSIIIDDLFNYEHTILWCEDHEQWMLQKLQTCINSHVIDFSIDQFIDIKGVFYSIHSQLDTLRSLGLEIKLFPSDYYSFASLVLSSLFELNAQKDLPSWLNILTYHTEKDSEMQIHLKKALILEWLNHTKKPQHLISIALYLKNYLNYALYQIQELFKSKKINFSQLPFSTPYSLSCFLQLYSESERLSPLMTSIPTQHLSILKFSLKKPEFFFEILNNLNAEQIMKLMLRYTIKSDHLWFYIPLNQEILSVLNQKLAVEDFETLLNLKNKLEQNILHLQYQNKAVVQVLTAQGIFLTHQHLILDKDCFGQNSLFLALQTPEIFKLLLNQIPNARRFQILLHLNHGDLNLLEMAISKPKIIEIILDSLHAFEQFIITQVFGEEIILHHLQHTPLVEKLLRSLFPEVLDDFLLKNVKEGQRFIDCLSDNHEALMTTLKICRPDKVYEYLLSEGYILLEKIAKEHPLSLIEIFKKIFDYHLTHLLQSDVFFKTVLESKDILYAYLDKLSDRQMQTFLRHHNQLTENWIDLMNYDPQILNAILSFNAKPRELITEKLINKFINHPLCLKVLIQYIPEESKTDWIFSLREAYLQNLKAIESLFYLFNVLPKSQHVNLLIAKHRRYHNIYHWLMHHFKNLIQALPLFDSETITFINHKMIQQPHQLESFIEKPERVPAYLEFLNPQQTFEFLLCLCQNNAKKPLDSNIKLAILKFAVNYQGSITSFSPKHFSSAQQKNPMWSAIRNAKFFKDCIPALQTRGLSLNM